MNVRHLAQICSVSRTTVSSALRDDWRISSDVRLKIQQAARETGYQPDPRVAQGVAKEAGRNDQGAVTPLALISLWPNRREWELNGIHIVGVVDPLPERLKEVWELWHTRGYTNLRESLAAAVRSYGTKDLPWKEITLPAAYYPLPDYYEAGRQYFRTGANPPVSPAESRLVLDPIACCRESAETETPPWTRCCA